MNRDEREYRRKKLAEENAKPIKRELWLWFRLFALGIFSLIIFLLVVPTLSFWFDFIRPEEKGIILIFVCVGIFAWIKWKTK